jgi:hypothetical protein
LPSKAEAEPVTVYWAHGYSPLPVVQRPSDLEPLASAGCSR